MKSINFQSSKFYSFRRNQVISVQSTVQNHTECHLAASKLYKATITNLRQGMSWNKILTDQVNRLREYAMENSEMGKRDTMSLILQDSKAVCQKKNICYHCYEDLQG